VILAIGDSNLYPACTEVPDTPDPNNMISVFSNYIDQPFRCWSKNGASNYWIETHIEYFLADSSWPADTFLFVGWTSAEREEWPWLYSNISVCGGPDFGIPNPLKAKYTQWQQTLTKEYQQQCINLWHDRIHAMHLKLQSRGIRHLFWMTYDNFKSIADRRDWHGNFFQPYDQDGCMVRFLNSKNIQPIVGDPFHYNALAHKFWAQTLSGYAKEKSL